jgi:ketosteroid isomerase-like protein
MNRRAMLLSAPVMLAACASAPRTGGAALASEMMDTERAFAATLTARDHAAFASFLAEDAVFLNGGRGELRGKAAIAEYWKRYYAAPQAPFSWRPDRVAVLDAGTLAYSTGPVAAPDGRVFARFYSTWRREPSGAWRIVFDDGCNLQEQCNANAVHHP